MLLTSFFNKLGLDVDAASFARGQLAVEGIKLGLSALASMARVATTGLKNMVESVVQHADAIDETAQATGISTDSLQELAYAASFSGMSMQDAARGMFQLTKNMQAAKDGSKETAAAFNQLGVNIDEGHGNIRNADEVLGDLAEKFSEMPDSGAKSALANKLFSKSAKQMIPLLNEGRAGLERLKQEAHDLGLVMDGSTIKSGVKAADAMGTFKKSLEGLKNQIVGPLLPALAAAAKSMTEWVKANRALIRTRVTQFLTLLGAALKVAWFFLRPIVKLLGFFLANLRLIALVIGSVLIAQLTLMAARAGLATLAYVRLGAAAVAAGLRTAAAWVLASLPFLALTAVVLGLALVLEDLWGAMHGKDSLLFNGLGGLLDPQGDDPWWLTAMRVFLGIVMDLPKAFAEAIDFWKQKFDEMIGWMTDQLVALGIISVAERGPKMHARFNRGSQGFVETDPVTGAVTRRDALIGDGSGRNFTLDMAQMDALVGGFAAQMRPTAPIARNAFASALQSVTNQITVHAAPGMDEAKLAEKVGEVVTEAMATQALKLSWGI